MNKIYKDEGSGFNLCDLLWELASRWKLLLLSGFIGLLLLASFVYSSAIKNYNISINAVENSPETIAEIDDEIESIYMSLPEEDRNAVRFVIRQEESIEKIHNYLEQSVLMNLDPENTQILKMGYAVSGVEREEDIAAICKSYYSAFDEAEPLAILGKIISPDSSPEYIRELISFYDSNDSQALILGEEELNKSGVVQLNITIPGDIEISTVDDAIDDIIHTHINAVSKATCAHQISCLYSNSYPCTNVVIAEKYYNKNLMLANLQTWHDNSVGILTENQRNTYGHISRLQNDKKQIMSSGYAENNQPAISKPTFVNNRAMMLGFLIGVIVYIAVFVTRALIRKRITSPSEASYYSKIKMFGEVYREGCRSAASWLSHSKLVNRIRYGNRLEEEKQIGGIVDSIVSTCKHNNVNKLSIIKTSEDEANEEILNKIHEKCKEKDESLVITIVEELLNESQLLDIDNAIISITNNTFVETLCKSKNRCKDYDINILGVIYTGLI